MFATDINKYYIVNGFVKIIFLFAEHYSNIMQTLHFMKYCYYWQFLIFNLERKREKNKNNHQANRSHEIQMTCMHLRINGQCMFPS